MPRVTNSPASRKRRKKVLKQTRGYFASKSKLFRYAKEALDHALQYAYDDRKKKRSNARCGRARSTITRHMTVTRAWKRRSPIRPASPLR